jgi:hypothetical protein
LLARSIFSKTPDTTKFESKKVDKTNNINDKRASGVKKASKSIDQSKSQKKISDDEFADVFKGRVRSNEIQDKQALI